MSAAEQHSEIAQLQAERDALLAREAVLTAENARLLTEQREALERRTATAEVLKVISQSPTDVQPVFDAIAQTALRLLRCDRAFILRCDDTQYWPVSVAVPEGLISASFRTPLPIDPAANFPSRAIVEQTTIYLPDWSSIALPEHSRGMRDRLGINSALYLPLLSEGKSLGVLAFAGKGTNIFDANDIALAESFRDQAVIALENARLLGELRDRTEELAERNEAFAERIDHQAATIDVLKVMSASPGDDLAVLDVIVRQAQKMCGSASAGIVKYDGELLHYVARTRLEDSERLDRYLSLYPMKPRADHLVGLVALTGKTINIKDAAKNDLMLQASRNFGVKSAISIPLLKDGISIGVLTSTKSKEGGFTQSQIALLETFAEQAVIAIGTAETYRALQARTEALARSLDDLRRTQDRLVQTEKLASLGQLTAGIAHEIKNPLNFVNNFAELSGELLGELETAVAAGDAEELADITGLLRDNLGKIAQHGKRADSIVKNMLQHSRTGASEARLVGLNALTDEALNLAFHGARAAEPGFNVTLKRSFDPAVGEVELYPQEITRVLLNLIGNGFYAARQHAGEAATLWLSTQDHGDTVEIRVRDNGAGIPDDARAKLFQPFFTTKPTGEGTGLGLSISYDIVAKQHGGQIEVESEVGRFTEFTVRLPRRPLQTEGFTA